MDLEVLNFHKPYMELGTVFTPIATGVAFCFLTDLHEKIRNGNSIFDPTCGTGNLLMSSIEVAKHYGLSNDSIKSSFYGNEINKNIRTLCISKIKNKYGIDLSNNIFNTDIFNLSEEYKFDVIFGNPPWINYNDMPDDYKEIIKINYLKLFKNADKKSLLWGGSRVELAGIVTSKVLKFHCIDSAYMFLPSSLIFNPKANDEFRKFVTTADKFFLNKIYNLNTKNHFKKVSTKSFFAVFTRQQTDKISSFDETTHGNFESSTAYYTSKASSNVLTKEEFVQDIPEFKTFKSLRARQGVNTCGANQIFFMDSNQIKKLKLENMYPLITKDNFKNNIEAIKHVLLLHTPDGKPFNKILNSNELDYLLQHKNTLENRKGTMIQSHISKGHWWALLGVGPYTFEKYKVVWEALGKSEMVVKIFSKEWVPNQSLQSYISLDNEDEAIELKRFLESKLVLDYLISFGMAGTMNWAQPSRINDLIKHFKPIDSQIDIPLLHHQPQPLTLCSDGIEASRQAI